MVDLEKLEAELRRDARRTSAVARDMAEAKSLRQPDNLERRRDLYSWPEPEQTVEWRAADTIATLRAEVERMREALGRVAQKTHGHQALAEEGRDQPRHLYPYYSGQLFRVQDIARAALGGTDGE